MIITKTPYRISFFGGGSDYPLWYQENGGEVLSTTIDKYIYLSCRNLPPFFNHKHRIVWSKVELVKNIKEIQHKAVKYMLNHYKIKNGLEIHYDGDLPARSGMGSSSCFVVGLINTMNALKKIKLNKKELAFKSINFEQKILRETVGSQDQIAAVYGGFNKIKFYPNGNFKVFPIKIGQKKINKLNQNLVLLYTGVKRTAHHIANTYVKKLNKEKKNEILKILELTKEAENILRKDNFDDFGRLLHESWLTKRNLSKKMTSSSIDDIYNFALKKGALGGKLLGAGGGGFFLLYVPYKKQKNFMKNFKKSIHIPFKFSNIGSTIIFNQTNL
ncbi:hypothetical protein OAJ18_01680 [Pelagibacteraceae bacterium]|nr:hypothetical protein [Pelagibacteraceae bacterium]